MNDKKFWKIVYLYITKYGYDILYYRPEKRDVWLINEDNELIRFIYSNKFRQIEVDSVVSNIIKNELTLKKMFKLNSLKIKVFYVAAEYDENIVDYKKHKISNSLIIERILFNEKYRDEFIEERDRKFITATLDSDKYKDRVVDLYKKKYEQTLAIDWKFNIISLIYVVLFLLHLSSNYLSKGKFSLFDLLDYNYQSIISGEWYRLFTAVFVTNDIKVLSLIVFVTVICSIIFNGRLQLQQSLVTLLSLSFVFNMVMVFAYSSNINVVIICYFGALGAIFLKILSGKTDNIKFIFSILIPIVYLFIAYFIFKVSLVLCLLSFILGIFLQIFLLKKSHIFVALGYITAVILVGVVIVLAKIDTKSKINNYRLNTVLKNLERGKSTESYKLEEEINSKNKSIISYYELGMIKINSSTIAEAKKVFLDGIKFDNSFAPIYYELALIERQESNFVKSKEYAKRAYELQAKDKYKNLLDELEKY